MFLFKKYSLKNIRGFTLTEMVSVLGLTILLVLLTYDVFLISQKSFANSDRRLEITQNGRIFLDRISRELRQTPEVATSLPATKSEIGFPAPKEILFQNGHDLSALEYLRYVLEGNSLKRQRIIYFFPAEPAVQVTWNARDEFGNPPQSQTLEDRIIAEYLSDLAFWGSSLVNIDVWLAKGTNNLHLFTSVWGRNTRQ